MKVLVGLLLIVASFQPSRSFGEGTSVDDLKALAAKAFAQGADGFKDAEKLYAAASPVKLKDVGHYPFYFRAECIRVFNAGGKVSYATAPHANAALWDGTASGTGEAFYQVYWSGKQVRIAYTGDAADAPGLPLLWTKLSDLSSGELGGTLAYADLYISNEEEYENPTFLRKLTLGDSSYWISYNKIQYVPTYKSPYINSNDWAVTYCKFLNK